MTLLPARWAKPVIRWGLVSTVLASVGGCNPYRMDIVDSIRVENRSDIRLHILVNDAYPDTSVHNARPRSHVEPHDYALITLVNRTWPSLLEEREKITVFFADWMPPEFYRDPQDAEQRIYGRIILTQAELDSLGWVITFPPGAEPESVLREFTDETP